MASRFTTVSKDEILAVNEGAAATYRERDKMCCVELVLDRLLCAHLGSKRFLRHGFSPFINPMPLPRWRAPTAVCGCHCPRDMVVRMLEVLAWLWAGVCVPLALSLHYFQGNFR